MVQARDEEVGLGMDCCGKQKRELLLIDFYVTVTLRAV